MEKGDFTNKCPKITAGFYYDMIPGAELTKHVPTLVYLGPQKVALCVITSLLDDAFRAPSVRSAPRFTKARPEDSGSDRTTRPSGRTENSHCFHFYKSRTVSYF